MVEQREEHTQGTYRERVVGWRFVTIKNSNKKARSVEVRNKKKCRFEISERKRLRNKGTPKQTTRASKQNVFFL